MRRGALKRELLIVATGDHNLRMSYAGGYAHHLHGVPILIWALKRTRQDVVPVVRDEGRQLLVGNGIDLDAVGHPVRCRSDSDLGAREP